MSMKNLKIASIVLALSAGLMSFNAQAAMTTDAHGNVGYDTAAECDAAVANGSARFYQSFTHKSPLKRKGEARVQTATLKDLGEQYASGACDVGVGRRNGRDGVSQALQGKFIPFSPDMPINVYTDKAGNALRVTMAQCDNNFSGGAPRPVAKVAVAETSTSTPAADTNIETVAVPAAAAAFAAKPYVFGTLGALHAGVDATHNVNVVTGRSKDHDTRVAGQLGFGVQFTPLLGAELFYTGSDKHQFDTVANLSALRNSSNTQLAAAMAAASVDDLQCYKTVTQQHTYGARLTLGHNFTENFRLFAKGGVAGTNMKITEVTGGQNSNDAASALVLNNVKSQVKGKLENKSGNFARGTAGLGATYNITDKLAIRGDYDHYFKKNYKYKNGETYTAKGKNYVGVGIQYNFR